MGPVRHLLARRDLATLLCAATLLLKLLVPTGYMIAGENGRIVLTLCSGIAPRSTAQAATKAMPGMHHAVASHATPQDHTPTDHGKPEMPCAFAGLTAAALGTIDPILLVALAIFILAAGFARIAWPAAAAPSHLRPPPRAPPARL